jgi:hypothetical protein
MFQQMIVVIDIGLTGVKHDTVTIKYNDGYGFGGDVHLVLDKSGRKWYG